MIEATAIPPMTWFVEFTLEYELEDIRAFLLESVLTLI